MLKILPNNGTINGTLMGDYLEVILPRNDARNSFLVSARTMSVFPRRGRDDAVQRQQVFPSVKRPRLSNQQENLLTPHKQHLHTNNKYSQPDVLKGLSIPFEYGASDRQRREVKSAIQDKQIMEQINCSNVFLYFWFNRSENKCKRKQIAKVNMMKRYPGAVGFTSVFS